MIVTEFYEKLEEELDHYLRQSANGEFKIYNGTEALLVAKYKTNKELISDYAIRDQLYSDWKGTKVDITVVKGKLGEIQHELFKIQLQMSKLFKKQKLLIKNTADEEVFQRLKKKINFDSPETPFGTMEQKFNNDILLTHFAIYSL